MNDLVVTRSTLDAGGGAFSLPTLTLGVFLSREDTHRLALGSDRPAHLPLGRHGGWLLPAGSEGICEYDRPLHVLTLSFDARLLEEVGLTRPDLVAPHVGDIEPLTLQLALNAESLASADAIYRETMVRALAAHLARPLVAMDPGRPKLDDRRLSRAVDYIHEHLGEDISLQALAAVATLSPFHFARAFKAVTGSSPLQYVIEARIELARVLLDTTKLPVAEIAVRVGFADPARFGRQFRKRVGMTPLAFRQR